MKYDLIIKRNEILEHAIVWMHLEIEWKNSDKKAKHYMSPFIQNIRNLYEISRMSKFI